MINDDLKKCCLDILDCARNQGHDVMFQDRPGIGFLFKLNSCGWVLADFRSGENEFERAAQQETADYVHAKRMTYMVFNHAELFNNFVNREIA